MHKLIQRLLRGSGIKVVDYQDGYTTALVLPLFDSPVSKDAFYRRRELLFSKLAEKGVAPTFGASMYFAFDGINEFIRFNYLANKVKSESFIGILKRIFRDLNDFE